MSGTTPSVKQTVSSMASVLKPYLEREEIAQLTAAWQQHSTVSVKMIQQCVMDTTTQYPKLKRYKSDIRKAFWTATLHTEASHDEEGSSASALTNQQASVSALVKAFYSVMLSLRAQLDDTSAEQLFAILHQTVAKERTFRGHHIEITAFLDNRCPTVPNDAHLLNNIVQLAYVCLCDVEGPVAADDMFYQVAEAAKAEHPNAVVEQLF
ncbi:hypothetical protein [Psychrobacter aestuarii]|uniref:Uncharacterized protein n=1 Tax=Psychrobacter aestuarii TaxID=556327 RepID=A0ABN0VKV8_9GAMM|nr:hypothetical protein [Psychrobacter aestuarii]